MGSRIDHFVIGAATLERGQAALRRQLGVTVPRGSKHAAMSTHNCVMQAGSQSFLELIAIDPEAPDPGRPRWFSLDDPATRNRIANRPRALCWVAGTDDIDALVARSPVDLGEIVHFRRGDRSWRLTVPADGHLPEGGLLPAFIAWSPGPHPSTHHEDLGVRLNAIVLSHPAPARLAPLLEELGVRHLVRIVEGRRGLAFDLDGPGGAARID